MQTASPCQRMEHNFRWCSSRDHGETTTHMTHTTVEHGRTWALFSENTGLAGMVPWIMEK